MALSPRHPSRVREAKYSGHDRAQGECATVLDKKSEVRLIRMIFNPPTPHLDSALRGEALLHQVFELHHERLHVTHHAHQGLHSPKPSAAGFPAHSHQKISSVWSSIHATTWSHQGQQIFLFFFTQSMSITFSVTTVIPFQGFWICAMYASRVETPFQ